MIKTCYCYQHHYPQANLLNLFIFLKNNNEYNVRIIMLLLKNKFYFTQFLHYIIL